MSPYSLIYTWVLHISSSSCSKGAILGLRGLQRRLRCAMIAGASVGACPGVQPVVWSGGRGASQGNGWADGPFSYNARLVCLLAALKCATKRDAASAVGTVQHKAKGPEP